MRKVEQITDKNRVDIQDTISYKAEQASQGKAKQSKQSKAKKQAGLVDDECC